MNYVIFFSNLRLSHIPTILSEDRYPYLCFESYGYFENCYISYLPIRPEGPFYVAVMTVPELSCWSRFIAHFVGNKLLYSITSYGTNKNFLAKFTLCVLKNLAPCIMRDHLTMFDTDAWNVSNLQTCLLSVCLLTNIVKHIEMNSV